MGQGFFCLVLADESQRQMIMRPGRVRVKSQRLSELVCRFARAVQLQERKPQVVVVLRITRIKLHSRGKVTGAFAQLALSHQGYAQVAVGLPVIGLEPQGLREISNGFVQLRLHDQQRTRL